MPNSFDEIRNGVDRIIASIPDTFVRDFGFGVLVFVFFTALYSIFLLQPRGRASLKCAVRDVFPPELFTNATSRVDRWHFFIAVLLWVPIGTLLVLILSIFIGIDVRATLVEIFGQRNPLFHAPWAVITVQALAVFLIRHFHNYFSHYLMHKVPFLWSIHRAHHSAEALTIFTTLRSHPLEFWIHAVLGSVVVGGGIGLMLFFTGTTMHPATFGIVAPAMLILNVPLSMFYHSHIPISFGWFNRIVGGPVMHQIHHSAEIHHRDKNFGTTIMIYDWLFGTIYIPHKGEKYRWGLEKGELADSNPHIRIRDFYFEPIVHSWQVLRGTRKKNY